MTHDVVILGGGPAGSVTAKRLAAAGVRVALVGAASRPGWEGLSVRSRALLEEGLGSDAAFIEGPFARRGTWASGRSVEGVEWLVERSRLAEALRSQAKSAGAHCRSDRVATTVRLGGRWRVSLRSGRWLEAPILIDARGRRGAERRGPLLLAFGQRFRRQDSGAPGTQIHATDFGWCWWAEQGHTLWLQLVGHPRGSHPATWAATAAAQVPALACALTGASPAGDPIAVPAHARFGVSRHDSTLWRVGDAAMALDPLSGQGVYEALRDARIVAAAVRSVLDGGCASLAHRFVTERHEEIWQRGVRVAADLYRENSGRSRFWVETAAAYTALLPNVGRFEPRIERRPVLCNGRIVEHDVVVTPENPRGVWRIANVPVAHLKRHFDMVEHATADGASLALQRPTIAVERAIHWLRAAGAMPPPRPAVDSSGD
jgi:2-polyprenyl-6-methoxyphenol hydroxylase-like FAD-dependent oxidoreductase